MDRFFWDIQCLDPQRCLYILQTRQELRAAWGNAAAVQVSSQGEQVCWVPEASIHPSLQALSTPRDAMPNLPNSFSTEGALGPAARPHSSLASSHSTALKLKRLTTLSTQRF